MFLGFSASSLIANDFELMGDFIKTQLTKSAHGLGFTIVSAGDSSIEMLQIKSILPGGPADIDGQLHTGEFYQCIFVCLYVPFCLCSHADIQTYLYLTLWQL